MTNIAQRPKRRKKSPNKYQPVICRALVRWSGFRVDANLCVTPLWEVRNHG